ncbi:MAG: hypothetical protein QW808_04045 [Desulfurococcaceae archaeon]
MDGASTDKRRVLMVYQSELEDFVKLMLKMGSPELLGSPLAMKLIALSVRKPKSKNAKDRREQAKEAEKEEEGEDVLKLLRRSKK